MLAGHPDVFPEYQTGMYLPVDTTLTLYKSQSVSIRMTPLVKAHIFQFLPILECPFRRSPSSTNQVVVYVTSYCGLSYMWMCDNYYLRTLSLEQCSHCAYFMQLACSTDTWVKPL